MTQYVTVGYSADYDRYQVEIYTPGDSTADEVLDVPNGEEPTARALASEVAQRRNLPFRDPIECSVRPFDPSPASSPRSEGLARKMRYNNYTALRNYTPHPVSLMAPDGTVTTLDPELTPIRIKVTTQECGRACGFPVVEEVTRKIRGLPTQERGVGIIVSRQIADYCMARNQYYRTDLLVPGDQVQDDTGRVIGCRHLVMVCSI